jgi:hypothetical protein
MHSGLSRRVVAALTAVWMVVAVIEPAGIYVCPMHSAAAVQTQAPVTDASSAEHKHGHEATADAERAPGSDHHGSDCRCIGKCVGVAGAVMAPAPLLTIAAAIYAPEAVPPTPAHAPVSRGGLVLPFSNGPPSNT